MHYWLTCLQIAQLISLAPHAFGGVIVRARFGPVRERWLGALEQIAKHNGLSTPLRKIPNTISDENLLGGLDLEATITLGKPVFRPGLLSQCDQSLAIIPMAERLESGTIARIVAALDHGVIQIERDGYGERLACAMGVAVIDEGIDEDECINPKLMDRCAFLIDLDTMPWRELPDSEIDLEFANGTREQIDERVARIHLTDAQFQALVGIAAQLGVDSLRAVQFAVRTARYLAAMDMGWDRSEPSQEHLERAVTLVLLPRATQIPNLADESSPEEPPNPESSEDQESDDSPTSPLSESEVLEDQVLEAAQASIPRELLERLMQLAQVRQQSQSAGKSGASQLSRQRGRPMGSSSGVPNGHQRLSLIDTIRAAVPWQGVRRQQTPIGQGSPSIRIRKEDLRIKRYQQRNQTLTAFVVDASGSSAIHRLAEAKGAVELLLAECYVRRDQVALISFRGSEAELLLTPTRSLVRAKRSLASLPGGGGTPLAKAIDTAFALARSSLKKGMTPTLVFLTDGRGNIARDGTPGRAQAQFDAEQSAKFASQIKVRSLWIDTSPQAREEGKQIAQLIGSYYLPLPHARAQELSQAVISVLHH